MIGTSAIVARTVMLYTHVCSSSIGTQMWPSSFGTSARLPPRPVGHVAAQLLRRHEVVIDAHVEPVVAEIARATA